MKKIMYLFLAGGIFVLTACNSGSSDPATEVDVEEAVEAVGCQAERGTCLADHSCCIPKE